MKKPMIAVIEFDGLSLDDQCRFWGGCPLPVYVLVYSGGKSIHGWVKTGCQTAQEWEARIENRLFRELLDPMVLVSGAQAIDKSCKNEARLSRIPGAFRRDKNKVQRLLYLAPEGKPVMR